MWTVVIALCILHINLAVGEYTVSHPNCFVHREKATSNYWFGGWVDSRTIKDAV
jgi:hypothetical protein